MRKWLLLAVVCFSLAGFAGALLRLMFVTEVPGADFRNVLHGHSHLTMLGWLYPALFILLLRAFTDSTGNVSQKWRRLYKASLLTAVLVFVAMIFLGYSSVSIAMLTVHIVLSYIFSYWFLRDVRFEGANMALRFARTGIVFMLVSTLALWALGPIMGFGKAGSALYYATIQFFLHFQLNGWYIFGALAVLLKILADREILLKDSLLGPFYYLLVISTCLTYVLAVTWSTPLPILFILNSAGVIVQLFAFLLFARLVRPSIQAIYSRMGSTEFLLFSVGLSCFALKIIAQSMLVVPFIATIAYTIRNFVIGFIHLIVLGMITHLVLSAFCTYKIIPEGRIRSVGLLLIFIGFVVSEVLLFGQGVLFWAAMGFLPGYYPVLFAFSVLIPLGAGLIAISLRSKSA